MADVKQNNEQFFVHKIPQGMPTEDCWEKRAVETAQPTDGQVLVKALYVSVDPYLRGRMYSAKAGDAQVSGVVAEVVESRNDKFPKGTIVHGYLPWARYSLSTGADLRVVDPSLAPVSTANSVLGMPGMTAYFGLLSVGELKDKENVVVSGAAGAVGSLVVQIAKLKGCHVVGIVGSKDKADYVTKELGADVAINYKDFPDQKTISEELKKACPNGVDVYFDNVGGYVSDAVYDHINNFARVALCGQISSYNELDKQVLGPRFLYKLIYKNATIKGFVVSAFLNRSAEFFEHMGKWVKEGKVKYRETVVEGFDNIPKALIGMLQGENTGKMIVKV